MTQELRREFHDRLAEVRRRSEAMGGCVLHALRRVTVMLESGDTTAAPEVIADDADVDAAHAWLEPEIFDLVARQAPVGRDLRFLVAALRIAQELERCGDLTSSIARRVAADHTRLDHAHRRLLAELGSAAADQLERAMTAYAGTDVAAAEAVVVGDDEVDELHQRFLARLFAPATGPVEQSVELGMVARFFERIADHAVVIAERVRFIESGRMDPADRDEEGLGPA